MEIVPAVPLRESYTQRGLHTVLRHDLPADVGHAGAALVLSAVRSAASRTRSQRVPTARGAMSTRETPVLRVGYQEPNNLDLCAHDLVVGVELARNADADRVVAGHNFGGAVAIRTAVVMTGSVVGVVNFATQLGWLRRGRWIDQPTAPPHPRR